MSKCLNKFLKKLRDSGSMRRRTGSGLRRSSRSDASLVFTTTVRTYKTKYELGVCFKFSGGIFLPKTSRIGWNLTLVSQKWKGDVFWDSEVRRWLQWAGEWWSAVWVSSMPSTACDEGPSSSEQQEKVNHSHDAVDAAAAAGRSLNSTARLILDDVLRRTKWNEVSWTEQMVAYSQCNTTGLAFCTLQPCTMDHLPGVVTVCTSSLSQGGGSRILQRRVSNSSERGTGGRASNAPREG